MAPPRVPFWYHTTPFTLQKTVKLSYLQRNHCTASTKHGKTRLVVQILTILIDVLVVVMKHQRVEGLVAPACVIINPFIDMKYSLMRVTDSGSAASGFSRACVRACVLVCAWENRGWILTKQKLNFACLKKNPRSSLQPHFLRFPARKRTKKGKKKKKVSHL